MPEQRKSFDYMNPVVASNLTQVDIPLVHANAESLKGYGELVSDYQNHIVEIVTSVIRLFKRRRARNQGAIS